MPYDDEDGKIDTDGAIIVDSITVRDDYGVIDYEDFEAYPSGSKRDLGIWNPSVPEPFGNFSALANNLIDKDPCADNYSTQVIFFSGSPYPTPIIPACMIRLSVPGRVE